MYIEGQFKGFVSMKETVGEEEWNFAIARGLEIRSAERMNKYSKATKEGSVNKFTCWVPVNK